VLSLVGLDKRSASLSCFVVVVVVVWCCFFGNTFLTYMTAFRLERCGTQLLNRSVFLLLLFVVVLVIIVGVGGVVVGSGSLTPFSFREKFRGQRETV